MTFTNTKIVHQLKIAKLITHDNNKNKIFPNQLHVKKTTKYSGTQKQQNIPKSNLNSYKPYTRKIY